MNDINEPIHLVNAITEQQGFETAVYCTYGVDLAFFEEAILHPLRVNGCRRHIIFVDAARYADTLRDLRDSANWIGRRYLLIPMHMPPYQSFHSKMVLLLGPERGRLLLGSGNLTFTGFGHNCELYTCLDWHSDQRETLPIFQAAWQFIQEIQKKYGHSLAVDKILKKTGYIAYWLSQENFENDHRTLQFLHTQNAELLGQLSSIIGSEAVNRLTIITPFLDKKLLALEALNQQFAPKTIRLILQDKEAVGDADLLGKLQQQGIPLQIYRFNNSERYLHAKLLLLETENGVYALTGSPNCTRSAILSTSKNGNIETALLRYADNPDYFNYLINDHVLPDNIVDPQQLTLRENRLLNLEPEELEHDKHHGSIRLLNASVQGSKINLTFTITGIPEDNSLSIQLKLAPTTQFISLGQQKLGNHEIELDILEETANILQRETAVSVSLVADLSEDTPYKLQSNELWLTYLNELTAQQRARHDVGRATDFFASMMADSENDWKDLYVEITHLVSLDVTRVSKQAKTYAATDTQKNASQKETVEKETDITLATEENTHNFLELNETELTAAAVAQDDNIQAFLDHIRYRFPGKPTSTVTTNVSPRTTTRIKPTTWTVERRTRVRFTNLVHKYIQSLQNPDFMKPSRAPYNFKYFVIFQRLIHLMLIHAVVDKTTYLQFIQELNSAFFGSPSNDSPPARQPLIRHHLRFAWSDQWVSDDVDLYALASLLQANEIHDFIEDEDLKPDLQQLWYQVLAGILTINDLPALQKRIESLDPLEEVAHVHQTDASSMAIALLDNIRTHLPEVVNLLEEWTRKVAFDSQNISNAEETGLLYQANVDYRRALFFIYGFQGNVDEQINLGRELVFWTKRAKVEDESKQWGERLIEIYRQQGDPEETALALYNQAHKLFLARDYTMATQLVNEALALLPKEANLTKKCNRLLGNIKFLNA